MVRFTLKRSLRDGFLLQGGSDERRHRVALLLARAHRLDDVVGAFELRHHVVGGLLRSRSRRVSSLLLDQPRA